MGNQSGKAHSHTLSTCIEYTLSRVISRPGRCSSKVACRIDSEGPNPRIGPFPRPDVQSGDGITTRRNRQGENAGKARRDEAPD